MQGNFNATIVDYGLSETKGELPQVWADFSVQLPQSEGGGVKTVTWRGSFKDGAKDITLKNLLIMGMAPSAPVHLLNNGVEARMLNTQKTFDLLIEPETYEGKTRDRIKFINDPENPTHTQKRLDQAGVAKHMSGLNFQGDLIRLANEMGLNTQGQNQGQANTQSQNQNQNYNQNNGQGQNQNHNQNQGNFNGNFQNNNQGSSQNNQQNNGQNQNFNQNQNQNMNNGGQWNGNGQQNSQSTNTNQQFNGGNGGQGNGQPAGDFKAPF